MPRGRLAASAHSDTSEVDIDGTGNVACVFVINEEIVGVLSFSTFVDKTTFIGI